jgi:hypothetical protein
MKYQPIHAFHKRRASISLNITDWCHAHSQLMYYINLTIITDPTTNLPFQNASTMAKKAKMTEQDKERLEQYFQHVRDQSLRQWYAQSHDVDPRLSAAAQARLQLQIWLRETRREITTRRQERNAHKANNNTNELATVRKKLKKLQYAMAMHTKMALEGISASTEAKACRKWAAETHTLDEILSDGDLDKKTEFSVNRNSLIEFAAQEGSNDEDPTHADFEDADIEMGGVKLEEQDIESSRNFKSEEDDLADSVQTPTNIWSQHALHMQHHYRSVNLPDHAIETKLAFQKKLFDKHMARECERRSAVTTTEAMDLNVNSSSPRAGTKMTYNPVLATTTFSEHSLWELTSPSLWSHFEGKDNWDTPGWVPSGTMRIQTMSGSTHIYFDFGSRTYSAQRVEVPATCRMGPVFVSARCDQTGEDIDVDITFLDRGFVRVDLLIDAILPKAVGWVELTGIWLGAVE